MKILFFSLTLTILGILLWSNLEFIMYESNGIGVGWMTNVVICGLIGVFKNRVWEGLMWGMIAPLIGVLVMLSKQKKK
jgi:hypothetical protein